jgi:biotin transport system substrate-specific component
VSRVRSLALVNPWSGKWGVAFDAGAITSAALLTALLAQIRVPLPFTPVPVSGQTLAVLLAGAVLGARRGFLSQVLYLAAGAAGLHVFAAGSLTGPTAGYLWSFPLAALVAGWLVERGADRGTLTLALAMFAADACILAGGVLWLRVSMALSLRQALLLGFAPFWLGEVLKIALIASLPPSALKRLPRPSR